MLLSLVSVREKLHSTFMLPSDQPLVRRRNAWHFPDEVVPGGYLLNPHIGLQPSGGRYTRGVPDGPRGGAGVGKHAGPGKSSGTAPAGARGGGG